MSAPSEVVERAARAAHEHNNSGVNADISPLSWDNEQAALKKWHFAMATAALDALHAEGLILYPHDLEEGRIKLNDGSFWHPIAASHPEGWSEPVLRRVREAS